NVYAATPRVWTPDELAAARVFADMATSYLLNASERERAARVQAQLQEALDTRVVIEQAKGMLAGTYGISLDAAFDRLRRHARTARRVRSWLSDLMRGAMLDTEPIILNASDLRTNAICHARTGLEVSVETTPNTGRLAVRDGVPATATRRHLRDDPTPPTCG